MQNHADATLAYGGVQMWPVKALPTVYVLGSHQSQRLKAPGQKCVCCISASKELMKG